jgi:aryl-alcohol dehydrogenase-like predicted oxidoreductase
MSTVPVRKLGKNGPEVTALGFGAMGLSAGYGKPKPDSERFALLDHIFASGAHFWDSSDIYGDNEELIGQWIKQNPGKREQLFLATKFGGYSDPKTGAWSIRNDPEYIHQAVASSLKKLGIDHIDLYYIHRVDGDQPIEIAMQEMKKLQDSGKIKCIGISECSAETLRRACTVAHVDAVQIEYSPFSMDIEDPQINLLETARELGVATIAYSPLGRGFLTGSIRSPDDFEQGDFRTFAPRFSKENFPKNLELVDAINALAEKKGCTPGQLVLAFLMAQGDDIIPIPGTTRVKNFDENMGALKVNITKEDSDAIRKAISNAEVKGARYPEMFAKGLFVNTVPLKAKV